MSTADTGSAKVGLGLWPKLILWSLVLVFGVLYLGSVKRNPPDPQPEVTAAPVTGSNEASPSASPAGAHPGLRQASDDDRVVAAEGTRPEQSQVSAGDTEPVRAAESAAFADSLLDQEVVDGDAAGPRDPESHPAGRSAPGAAEPAPGSPQTMPSDARAIPAQGIAEAAVMPGSGVAAPPVPLAPAQPLPAPAAPVSGRGPGAQAASQVGPGGPTGESLPAQRTDDPSLDLGTGPASRQTAEAQRARILWEYEAMRRAAEQQMRQRWQPIGVPGGAIMPYGSPGYGPGPRAYPHR